MRDLGVVGEAVDAPSAVTGGRFGVQAIEQAAVDEGRPAEQRQEFFRVAHFCLVAVAGEVAVGGLGFFAESAFVDFGVQRGKKQVLQHGPVVGIAGVRGVVVQQAGDSGFVEQVVGNQPLFFDEPDEQQARDEADDVFFGAAGFLFRRWGSGPW